ncbi:efflux RND transporter periplasmic adaptor subunit [Massilia soli]|uniref:HlyD family efflux transporter periplasmic adaptor subunit n=1 Tax=Massilia soli TaxID=2792854 RepID=A0ABS7SMT4_9BURK|nr:HlyD family efflux transporter periplasmic adaptor subunit [Massilia soli]MBZ2207493.1 HlyD family efflux transporter periplasmic adaptor subunit [Massilia soli]
MPARRWLYAAGAAAVLVAALAWAFAPRPIQVEAATVSVGHFETAIEEDGKTRLPDQYLVSAPLSGLVRRITLREGDQVAAGSVVASMQPAYAPLLDARARREQQARVAAAQAQVRAASAALARAGLASRRAADDAARSEQLAREGFVAPSRLESDQIAALAAKKEYEAALAQRQIALHDVEQARAALEASAGPARNAASFPLRSPIDGQVLRVVQTSEAVVALGAPLLELGDLRKLDVVAELLTADALAARPGSEVRIDRWGGPVLKGRVSKVEPAAFTKISALGVEEQRVRVVIDILDPPEAAAALGVGYRVNVRIVTLSIDNVLKVPVSAVFPVPGAAAEAGTDGAMAVYAIEGGRAQLRPVRLGARNEREACVLAGLKQGARVIVYPAAEVRDGVSVVVREVARAL